MTKPTSTSKKPRKQHTPEFRDEAIKLADRIDVAAAAREFSLYKFRLYAWRSKINNARSSSEREQEMSVYIARLKRQLAEPLAILQNAATYFAKRLNEVCLHRETSSGVQRTKSCAVRFGLPAAAGIPGVCVAISKAHVSSYTSFEMLLSVRPSLKQNIGMVRLVWLTNCGNTISKPLRPACVIRDCGQKSAGSSARSVTVSAACRWSSTCGPGRLSAGQCHHDDGSAYL